jgi:thermitase
VQFTTQSLDTDDEPIAFYIQYHTNEIIPSKLFENFDSGSRSSKEYTEYLSQKSIIARTALQARWSNEITTTATVVNMTHTTMQGVFEETNVTVLNDVYQQLNEKDNISLPENFFYISFENAIDAARALDLLENDSTIASIDPVPIYRTVQNTAYPNDPTKWWELTKTQALDAMRTYWVQWNSNVKLAIVDDAIDITHEDLAWAVVDSRDVTRNDPNPRPWNNEQKHGTHTAWSATAMTNNGVWLASIWGWVWLVAIKASHDSEQWTLSRTCDWVAKAIALWANIISMSFWWRWSDWCINNLAKQYPDILFIAAAGNSNTDAWWFSPCNGSHIKCIWATNKSDWKASFSNYWSVVAISAPWVEIYSSVPNNWYASYQWTSMATPIVASFAWLLMSQWLSAQETRDLILQTADPITRQGWGRINVLKAVDNLTPRYWCKNTWPSSAVCEKKIGWYFESETCDDACWVWTGCYNWIFDWNETDVDCGWSCAPCANDKLCNTNSDCSSNYCEVWSWGNTSPWSFKAMNLQNSTSETVSWGSLFTKDYILINISNENCGPCKSKATAMNSNTTLQWYFNDPDKACSFAVINSNVTELVSRKNGRWWFVADHSYAPKTPATRSEISNQLKLGLENYVPYRALLHKDGSVIKEPSDSQILDICSQSKKDPLASVSWIQVFDAQNQQISLWSLLSQYDNTLVHYGYVPCGPCVDKAAQVEADTKFQDIISQWSSLWFIHLTKQSNKSQRLSAVDSFVWSHTYGLHDSTWLASALWINELGAPSWFLVQKDGTVENITQNNNWTRYIENIYDRIDLDPDGDQNGTWWNGTWMFVDGFCVWEGILQLDAQNNPLRCEDNSWCPSYCVPDSKGGTDKCIYWVCHHVCSSWTGVVLGDALTDQCFIWNRDDIVQLHHDQCNQLFSWSMCGMYGSWAWTNSIATSLYIPFSAGVCKPKPWSSTSSTSSPWTSSTSSPWTSSTSSPWTSSTSSPWTSSTSSPWTSSTSSPWTSSTSSPWTSSTSSPWTSSTSSTKPTCSHENANNYGKQEPCRFNGCVDNLCANNLTARDSVWCKSNTDCKPKPKYRCEWNSCIEDPNWTFDTASCDNSCTVQLWCEWTIPSGALACTDGPFPKENTMYVWWWYCSPLLACDRTCMWWYVLQWDKCVLSTSAWTATASTSAWTSTASTSAWTSTASTSAWTSTASTSAWTATASTSAWTSTASTSAWTSTASTSAWTSTASTSAWTTTWVPWTWNHWSAPGTWWAIIWSHVGNGKVESGEACDDGNSKNNDGCDSLGKIESWWYCVGEPSVCGTLDCKKHGQWFDSTNASGKCCGGLSSTVSTLSGSSISTTICYDDMIDTPLCRIDQSPSGRYVTLSAWTTPQLLKEDVCLHMYQDYASSITDTIVDNTEYFAYDDIDYSQVLFSDVWSHRERTAIEALRSYGIVKWRGNSLSYFEPDSRTSRAEFFKMLIRIMYMGTDTFDDSGIGDASTPFLDLWSQHRSAQYMIQAYDDGLLTPLMKNIVEKNLIMPNRSITRDEIVAILLLVKEWQDLSASAIKETLWTASHPTRASIASLFVRKFPNKFTDFFYMYGNEEYYRTISKSLQWKTYREQYDILIKEIDTVEKKKVHNAAETLQQERRRKFLKNLLVR